MFHFLSELSKNIKRLWEGRFTRGFGFSTLDYSVARFKKLGERHRFTVFQIISMNTGHFPFSVLDLAVQTGVRRTGHLTVLGFTVYTTLVPDVDLETGELLGADKRIWKFFFSCINHQNKTMEDI